ncbi:MAG: CTP synthase (glutamine hydrolyzing) [Candidatus Micrarchaeota archaeon]
MTKKPKFIVVAGSIMSGLGKGILSSSIGKLLSSTGYSVIPIKFDGYLNVDCGTMNPYRHGEVFVLDDGTEVDMDFGTYERFLNIDLPGICSITGGKLFQRIIQKERKGDYLGRDVQFIPHLTDEIKEWVRKVGKESKADIILVEVGGTAGDLENGYFLEAMRQLLTEEKGMFIQLTYVPSLSEGEQKTKPTQHATRLLQSLGIQPDMIICREQEKITEDTKKKIALYCSIPEKAVIDDPFVRTVYELPLALEKQNLYNIIVEKLGLEKRRGGIEAWKKLVQKITGPSKKELNIGMIGKYTAVKDAYVSANEALTHAAAAIDHKLNIHFIESADLEEKDVEKILKPLDGLVVPGGFGKRGVEGKIRAVEYSRKNKMPYLGLCLGMQLMVIEYARNVCGFKNANSTEFEPETENPVVKILPEKESMLEMGGTLRLGGQDVIIKPGTHAHKIYNSEIARERFRHRYEINPEYIKKLENAGLVFSGKAPKGNIMQITEIKDHPFFMGGQFHPEFVSRLERPSPLFLAFMKACAKE